jgi:hypothetical protein
MLKWIEHGMIRDSGDSHLTRVPRNNIHGTQTSVKGQQQSFSPSYLIGTIGQERPFLLGLYIIMRAFAGDGAAELS